MENNMFSNSFKSIYLPIKPAYVILMLVCLLGCKKKTQQATTPVCSKNGCGQNGTFFLTPYSKPHVISKDTTFTFKDSVNNTIQLKFRSSSEPVTSYLVCSCEPQRYHNLHQFESSYVLTGTNSCVRYFLTPEYNDSTNRFKITFNDTNVVFHGQQNTNAFSYFEAPINKSSTADVDSMLVNGKYYHNIVYLFYNVWPISRVTSCVYARKFGIIQFTYNGSKFNIVP